MIQSLSFEHFGQQAAAGVEKSIQRLSSGLRINSGADDAAGLSIAERLTGQIRGLQRSIQNAQDAISLTQTADGAITETQSILNRLRELAIQSQDDALNQTDRFQIQKEVDQLVEEIDRIASTTEFNTKKTLDGTSSSIVETYPPSLRAYQYDQKFEKLGAGNYEVKIRHREYGMAEKQTSATLYNPVTDRIATATSSLKSLSEFQKYNPPRETALELRGNQTSTTIYVNTDMSLDKFARTVEKAITLPKEQGGLGIERSSFQLNQETGQLVYKAGYVGNSGQVHFAMDPDWQKALGMQISQEALQPSYEVQAFQNRELNGVDLSAGQKAAPIEGLRLDFPPPMPAEASTEFIYVSPDFNEFAMSIITTNTAIGDGYVPGEAGDFNGVPSDGVARVVVPPREGQTFSDMVSIINTQIRQTAPHSGAYVSLQGNQAYLVSSETGESAFLEIRANDAMTAVLGGLTDGLNYYRKEGTGGIQGFVAGTEDISSGIDSPVDFQIRVIDQDGNQMGTAPIFRRGHTSYADLTSSLNAAMAASKEPVKVSFYDRAGDGTLQAYTTEFGTDSTFQVEIVALEKRMNLPSDVSFSIVDTDREIHGDYIPDSTAMGENDPYRVTSEAIISIPAGNYSLNDIEDLINHQIRSTPEPPGVVAKFMDDFDGHLYSPGAISRNHLIYQDGHGDFALRFLSDAGGTSAKISIYNVSAGATTSFGLAPTNQATGSGSLWAMARASMQIADDNYVTPTDFIIRVIDSDGRAVSLPVPANQRLSAGTLTPGSLADTLAAGTFDIYSQLSAILTPPLNVQVGDLGGWSLSTKEIDPEIDPWQDPDPPYEGVTPQTLSILNDPASLSTPWPLIFTISETAGGTTKKVKISIPAGENLTTFDFSTLNGQFTNPSTDPRVRLSGTGTMTFLPDWTPQNGPGDYEMVITLSSPSTINDYNEATRILGLPSSSGQEPPYGRRLELKSRETGSDTKFFFQVIGGSQNQNQDFLNSIGFSVYHYDDDKYGAKGSWFMSSDPSIAPVPGREVGSSDLSSDLPLPDTGQIHSSGESANWDADWQNIYTNHENDRASLDSLGNPRNPETATFAAGTSQDLFSSSSLLSIFGLQAFQDSITAESHNSDTTVLKSSSPAGGTKAFARILPLPITLVKETRSEEMNLQLSDGTIIEISLTKPLPPDGAVVGLTMTELQDRLEKKLTGSGLTFELDPKTQEVRFRTTELGKHAGFSLSLAIDKDGNPLDFKHYSGYGDSEFDLSMKQNRQVFQTGANQNQHLIFGISNLGSAALGIQGLDLTSIRFATQALGRIDRAMETASGLRSKLGALQNRLDSSINNLQTTKINLTDGMSRIRDADVAQETLELSKAQLKQQSSTKMLRQLPDMTKKLWEKLLNR